MECVNSIHDTGPKMKGTGIFFCLHQRSVRAGVSDGEERINYATVSQNIALDQNRIFMIWYVDWAESLGSFRSSPAISLLLHSRFACVSHTMFSLFSSLLSMTEVFTFVSLFLKVVGVRVYPRTDMSTSSGWITGAHHAPVKVISSSGSSVAVVEGVGVVISEGPAGMGLLGLATAEKLLCGVSGGAVSCDVGPLVVSKTELAG
jgi:hypothetical protein